MEFGIHNKVALVNAAGSGLGQAIALALAAEGVKVAVGGHSIEKIAQTVNLIKAQKGIAVGFVLDLSKPDTFSSTLAEIRQTLGPISILVNNTGGPKPTPVQGVALSTWQDYFQSMVSSVIYLTDLVLPEMKQQQWGRIISSTSSGVLSPIANLGISNTLRASLVSWSKTLANEVARLGITANILVPGRIATPRIIQLDSARAEREGKTVAEISALSAQAIPIGRLGRPEEYAAVAAFLASQAASYVTGSVIRVDGGMIASLS